MSTNWPSYRDVNYALRPAKNVERKMMADVLQCLARITPLSNYQYVGFGSIFFTDYRLFHRMFGMQQMVSVEGNTEDEDRVNYNIPFNCIKIKMGMSYEVLPYLDWTQKAIVWLDYDHDLARYVLDDVDLVCSRVASGSVVAVTVDGETKRLKEPKTISDEERQEWPRTARQQLERLVGQERISPQIRPHDIRGKKLMDTYRTLLTTQIAETLRSKNLGVDGPNRWHFRQIFNFRYADKAQMMTVGWILYQLRDAELIDQCRFDASPFHRDSEQSLEIKIPNLTFREMRGLDRHLPDGTEEGAFAQIPVPEEDKKLYHEVYRFFPAFTEADL